MDGRYWFPLLVAAIVIAGCVASNAQQKVQPATVPMPTPEPTFSTPGMANITIAAVTYTKTPDLPVQWAGSDTDPIIGDWRLMNTTYPCDAVFGYGDGHATCGIFIASQTRVFTWMHDNASEYTLTDTSDNRVVVYLDVHNSTMTSDFFPDGAYLRKVEF